MNRWTTHARILRRAVHRFGRIRATLLLLFIFASLAFHITLALRLASDEPDDGRLYSQLARNALEQGVFSAESAPPFTPTLIRLPGYPLFLAAVYSIFGTGNDAAVRSAQAVIYWLTCGLVFLLVRAWTTGDKRRLRSALASYVLFALCPFTLIYTAVMLTETVTMFFMALTALAATYALMSGRWRRSIVWWAVAGFVAGINVTMRPDAGLFALGVGITLGAGVLIFQRDDRSFVQRIPAFFLEGAIYTLAFALVLLPWTLRNEQVFGVLQPLAPAHAEMPDEFVAHGYFLWLRTWIDDPKYIAPLLWDLEDKPIKMDAIPASAFDSDDEKMRVSVLIDRYNHSSPPDEQTQDTGDSDDTTDPADENDSGDADTGDDSQDLSISPEVDAEFAQIARERIARDPLRFYATLPAKRAVAMWFDTHSKYYPFDGELFPLTELDNDTYQQFWLPLFAALVWLYTILALVGAYFLFRRKGSGRLWLILVILMSVPRIVFFATLENPEPRYYVELFLFAAALGGIACARISAHKREGSFAVEFEYGNDG